jgi:sugar O-acyltransferase (sialic acid O-acetyltransferase NeuD family)
MNKLIIIGAGRFGRFSSHLARRCNFDVVGFLDDTMKVETIIDGLPILGSTEDLVQLAETHQCKVSVCISNMQVRIKLVKTCETNNIELANLIHPTVIQYPGSTIGEGVIIQPYTVIQTGAVIENNTLIEEHCSIGVDTLVGKNTVIAPHVAITGAAKIEKNCFIGSNSTINPEVIVKSGCIIGSGSVVIRNTESNCVYAGSPVRRIRQII